MYRGSGKVVKTGWQVVRPWMHYLPTCLDVKALMYSCNERGLIIFSFFAFPQQWMDGGRRGPPGPPVDRTANTIVAEAALAHRLATAGNTVQAGMSLPPIAPEESALVSCADGKHVSCSTVV